LLVVAVALLRLLLAPCPASADGRSVPHGTSATHH
jgi:hypothetical protein